jgi:hypothetical protein
LDLVLHRAYDAIDCSPCKAGRQISTGVSA